MHLKKEGTKSKRWNDDNGKYVQTWFQIFPACTNRQIW